MNIRACPIKYIHICLSNDVGHLSSLDTRGTHVNWTFCVHRIHVNECQRQPTYEIRLNEKLEWRKFQDDKRIKKKKKTLEVT